jgi:hypothetical protein
MTQRRWTIEVTERELRVILTAFDIARDDTINGQWRWWFTTQYANRLYERLRDHGLRGYEAAS